MNKKNVMITLKSIQMNGKEKEETELITEGSYKKYNGSYFISYDESEVTGYEGSKTTLICHGDDQVELKRQGAATSNLIIEKGKKHHCHYGTPYGDFMVGISTKDIRSSLGKDGGDLYFNYVVDINTSYISEHEIFINVK